MDTGRKGTEGSTIEDGEVEEGELDSGAPLEVSMPSRKSGGERKRARTWDPPDTVQTLASGDACSVGSVAAHAEASGLTPVRFIES